jgi:acyl-CoA synthetase
MRTGAAEWIRLMKQVKSRVHFCMEMYHGEDMGAFIRANEAELGYELTNVYVDVKKHLPKGYNINELLEGPTEELPRPEVCSEDVAAILFTSGTTKGSRGVMLTHNNIISSELVFCEGLRLDCEDAIFMPAPLSHATGFHHGIISTMLHGGKIVLLDRYDARKSMEMMEKEQCTFSMGATPFVYDYLKLMSEGVPKPSALKFYICGGAPVPYELTRIAWNKHQLMVCECYGSTESVPHVFVPPEDAMEMKGLWSGKVFDSIEVRIVDEQGNDVPPGETGEEISRGPNVFVGYLGSPEETDLALDDEGWYHSGDLCYGDGAGHIKICGRKKDIIVRGGENLNINEMEANLHGCPGLENVAIVGMKDIRLGERVCAFVVPKDPEHPVSKEEISFYLKNRRVSKWLWPERIEYIDELPYTDSGKIKRYVLKEELEKRLREEKQ